MKHIYSFFLCVSIFLMRLSASGQEADMSVIKLKTGDEVKAKIISKTPEKVEYKSYYVPDGQSLITLKEKIAYIINPDGTKEVYGELDVPAVAVVATDTLVYTQEKTQEARRLGYSASTSHEMRNSYTTTLMILDKKGLPFKAVVMTNTIQNRKVTIVIRNLQTGEADENYMFTYNDYTGCLFTEKGDSVYPMGKQYDNLYIVSFIDNTKTYTTLHFIQKIGEYNMLFDKVSDNLINRNREFKEQARIYQKLLRENEQRINDSIQKQQEIAQALQRKMDEAKRVSDSIALAKKKEEERRTLYQTNFYPKIFDLKKTDDAELIVSEVIEKYLAENKVEDCYMNTSFSFSIDTNGNVINSVIPQADVDKLLSDDKNAEISTLRNINALSKKLTLPVTRVLVDGEYFPVKSKYSYPFVLTISNSTEKYHFQDNDQLVDKKGNALKPDIEAQFLKMYGPSHISGSTIKVDLYKLILNTQESNHIREITNKDGSHPVPQPQLATSAIKVSQAKPIPNQSVQPVKNVQQEQPVQTNNPKPVQSTTTTQPAPTAPIYKAGSADELLKLKDLLDAGIITKEEFDVQKKKILGN